ncbi:MAG: hypothetical protein RBR19_15025 [Sedimentisphaerales bacterium]|jgi:hypothetical protein|nr:hypothetical protein [Sedimentisphaerales bacterium]
MSSDKNKSHQKRTKTFEELSYAEQAKSMNMRKLNTQKMEEAHRRRARQEGRE